MVQPGLIESRPPAVLLVGATGTGKSGIALEWARRYPFEIVNLDASQFYRGMDIGTAKPTRDEQDAVPHHLFDIADPDDPLDAGRYVALADAVAREILGHEKIPLFVGGTGMYARALLRGLAQIPDVPAAVRDAVQAELDARGPAALHRELLRVDPEAAARIADNDPQRITRALEVFRHAGRPITDFQREHRFAAPRYDALVLGLDVPREQLERRIVARVKAMFAAGFVDEVRNLLAAGWSPDLRTFKALGYHEVIDLLEGRAGEARTRERVARRHLQYAKRQRTWFRKEPDVAWFTHATRADAEAQLDRFCEKWHSEVLVIPT
jgi:tRNA dimethylallyltransferase